MISYQYTYLIISLSFLLIWAVLFWLNKKLRKEILFMSTLFAFVAPFSQYVYIHDWWRPLTITNTLIGLEDIMFGFAFGGIAAVVYEYLFKKKVKYKSKKKEIKKELNLLLVSLIVCVIFFGGFIFTELNTFKLTLISFLAGTLFIYIKRKDLIVNSLLTGLLVSVLAIIIYTITALLTPGWIDKFLLFQNIPKIILLGVPLDDLIWFFVTGLFIGPLYEYWREIRLK